MILDYGPAPIPQPDFKYVSSPPVIVAVHFFLWQSQAERFAGLMAACPTTIIPFFGDQTFWGSAVYRRGVGPRPIPIDSLTTKKLVEALEFMQKPEVKAEAEKVSAQIKTVIFQYLFALLRVLAVFDSRGTRIHCFNL